MINSSPLINFLCGSFLVVFIIIFLMGVTQARAGMVQWMALLLASIITFICLGATYYHLPAFAKIPWLGWLYITNSTLTFFVYGYDKRGGQTDTWRIRERALHTLEFLGGWPGALMGSRYFHHKTNWQHKRGFLLMRVFIIVLHGLLWFGWYFVTYK